MYGSPGVYVRESILSNSPSIDPSVSTAVFVAAHGRGPLTPVSIQTWADFTRVFGGFPARTSLLPYALFSHFANGGNNAVVIRVPGTGAAVGSVELQDRDAGTPQPTLEISADNPGRWGNDIRVTVASNDDDRFSVYIHYQGTGSANIVERFNDLSMDPDSNRYVEAVMNSERTGSVYVTVTDLQSSSNATGDDFSVTRPTDTTEPVSLAGGADGEQPDAEALTNSLDLVDQIDRTFLLNFPGVSEGSVVDAALGFCETNGKGFLVVDPSPGLTPAEAVTYGNSLASSSYGAVYYPWVHARDPAAAGSGATKLIPPGGAVTGIITATDTRRGVFKAPAGVNAVVGGAVALERPLSALDQENLNKAHVNAIRHISQVGLCVYGARTLKRSDADKFIPVRRTMIYLRQALLEQTRWAVFEPNDQLLWSDLNSRLSQFLTGFWQSGGLSGNTSEEAFFVRTDASINTPDVVASGEVRVEVGVALRYPAEFVIITLSQWEGGGGQTTEATVTGPNT